MDGDRASIPARLLELLVDWLVIALCLVALAVGSLLVYTELFGGVPEFDERQTHLLSLAVSVLPVTLGCAVLDWCGGTPGKRLAGLGLRWRTRSFWRALVRNAVKFLPWQLGHTGLICGVYRGFENSATMTLLLSSQLLFLVLLAAGLFSPSRRHLGDLLAGTRVVQRARPGRAAAGERSVSGTASP